MSNVVLRSFLHLSMKRRRDEDEVSLKLYGHIIFKVVKQNKNEKFSFDSPTGPGNRREASVKVLRKKKKVPIGQS